MASAGLLVMGRDHLPPAGTELTTPPTGTSPPAGYAICSKLLACWGQEDCLLPGAGTL